jgi:outer membrane protein assembly factor BamB
VPHLLVTGGKEGTLYLVDRDNMGKFKIDDNTQIVENFSINVGLFGTPAFWENRLYVGGSYGSVELYTFAPSSGQFETVASAQTYHIFPWPGTTPSISSHGSMNGILWAVDEGAFGGGSGTGPVVLYAFDAVNLGQELWDSSQAANDRDRAGFAVKFVPPTIANGRVYVSTRTEIDVYGLLPN